MKKLIVWLNLIVAVLSAFSCSDNRNGAKLIFVCSEENDLFSTIVESNGAFLRMSSASEAIEIALPGSGILILADDYPQQKVVLPEDFFERAKNNNIRVYVEFPDSLPSVNIGDIQKTKWERGVITSDVFGTALKKMRIVMIHDCHYVETNAQNPHLVMAKVAGFDSAVYGLNATEIHPILFENSDANILVSTTKLSQFITGRYAPKDAWESIWKFIFSWLQPQAKVPQIIWNETVRPSFNPNENITKKVRMEAIQRGIDWYYKSAMLTPSRDSTNRIDQHMYGKDGINECYTSAINYDGTQPVSQSRRADCASEASMALALRGFLTSNQRDKNTAANLQDFVYVNSSIQQGPRNQHESPSFGFIDWFNRDDDNKGVYYSDDNARVILGTLTASAALNTDQWDEGMIKAILANFRTTGPAGFKPRRLEEPDLQELGWEYYQKNEYHHYGPHYQSWIWATYLWLYDKSNYQPLLELSKTGIMNMMHAYPDQWQWTNGLQQERARMVLPLAWLLRVDDTPQHRKWLYQIVDDLLSYQDETGAIREDLGDVGHGKYAPPTSNTDYGTSEAPLIQNNGDPIADMLYTSNFAFFSLTEAAAVTGDERFKEAVRKLADFMVRIQVRSEKHQELDGAWYRAFDFKRWAYWGSNADVGWGVWSTETGWTQAWITAMLMMQELKTNVWEFSAGSNIANSFEKYRYMLLPEHEVKQ